MKTSCVLGAYRQLSRDGSSSGGASRPGGGGTPTGSRNQSRESSRSRGGDSKPGTPPVTQELPKPLLERKTKAIIDEYLSIHDLKVRLLDLSVASNSANMIMVLLN